jgi:dual oxidase
MAEKGNNASSPEYQSPTPPSPSFDGSEKNRYSVRRSTEELVSAPTSPTSSTSHTSPAEEKTLTRSASNRTFTVSGRPSHRKFTFTGTESEPSNAPTYVAPDDGTVERNATKVPQHDVLYLTEEEIDAFVDDLDHDGNGVIDYSEVEAKLDAVHDELIDEPKPHNLTHDSMDDRARHAFLRRLMGSDAQQISRDEFKQLVRGWCIPSMKQEQEEEEELKAYMRSLPLWRRFRSWWSVHGPKVLFIAFVVCFELAFGLWQLIKYLTQPQYRAAFGWGVVVAKTCAGFLYPTMFLLVLSMSRYFSTFLRRSYHISKYINWDLSQSFHVAMSILAIFLGTLHSIAHLSGTFNFGSRPDRAAAVANLLGEGMMPMSYMDFIRARPGYTGIAILILFWMIAGLSVPQVRRWNYELFQLGHLLMFPIIALLMVHGSAALLQYPMMGFFLAFPTLLVLIERGVRVFSSFRSIPATLTVLDKDTCEITVTIPPSRLWRYKAGQYVFVQVPALSRWQWHPFTVSECVGKDMKVHIKVGGDWTRRLPKLAEGKKRARIEVGINGPFGAPAQRFYDYSHTILVGSGIGVTPFSGILRDLQVRDDKAHGGPDGGASRNASEVNLHRARSSPSPALSRTSTRRSNRNGNPLSRAASRVKDGSRQAAYAADYRRVDFHWSVRDRNHLLWFSDLLNSISNSQEWHHRHDPIPHLDIRIQTHVTQQRKSIATHVYRWLLELHRTEDHPESPLTGLVNSTHFGRPDFVKILDAHYEDMVKYMQGTAADRDKLKVGVFFCGTPVVGEILADHCRILTARGSADGTGIRYIFMTEVFE